MSLSYVIMEKPVMLVASLLVFLWVSCVVGNHEDEVVIVVDQSGSGDFKSVQAAVDSVHDNNFQRTLIRINPGIYIERVIVGKSKTNVTLQGYGALYTQIAWNDTAASAGSTRKSASVTIEAPDFRAFDITFHNFAYPRPGSVGAQAVAVRVSADRAAFFRCNFYGAQDTLFDDRGRHLFQSCFIEGTIDYIFGHGLSLYRDCELRTVVDPNNGPNSGTITAQSRQKPSERTGFSFVNCKVTGTGPVYLGRPWGPYSLVVFSYAEMDDVVVPEGWSDWGDPGNDGTVFYAEHKCTGPGADPSRRVKWSRQLTDEEAAPYLDMAFIDGQQWLSE